MNRHTRRNRCADRVAGRLQSGTITVYDSRGETLARFKMKAPELGAAPPVFRKLRLHEQPDRAARVAKGFAVFIFMLAVAALLSVDDYEPTDARGVPARVGRGTHLMQHEREHERITPTDIQLMQ